MVHFSATIKVSRIIQLYIMEINEVFKWLLSIIVAIVKTLLPLDLVLCKMYKNAAVWPGKNDSVSCILMFHASYVKTP